MGRRILVLALLAAAVPSSAAAHARVVGGTQIQIASAPWTVFLRQTTKTGALLCTGAVVDPLHVLTAAHCVYDLSGTVVTPSTLAVRAGISNYTTPAGADAEQDRGVSSFRVQPGYRWSSGSAADDIAILALSAPLDLRTPQVQAAALPDEVRRFRPARPSSSRASGGRRAAAARTDR